MPHQYNTRLQANSHSEGDDSRMECTADTRPSTPEREYRLQESKEEILMHADIVQNLLDVVNGSSTVKETFQYTIVLFSYLIMYPSIWKCNRSMYWSVKYKIRDLRTCQIPVACKRYAYDADALALIPLIEDVMKRLEIKMDN